MAKPQRGAKLQPFGRLASDGTMPLISFSRARRGVGARRHFEVGQSSRAGPWCRGAPGRSNRSSALASSTLRPAYITTTRSAFSATTPMSWVIRMIAVPSVSCSSRIRSRICAWIVTSSAVVGSSAISSFGIARQRHRDHHALAHAARQLVRIGVHPALRLRDVHAAQHLDRLVHRVAPRQSLVQRDRLADLPADGHQRVQRGHRLLEDHRDVVAADRPPSRVSLSSSRLVPSKRIAPPTIRPGGSATRRRMDSAVTLLPQPDSPTTPSVSPAAHAVGDAVDRPHDAGGGEEMRLQIVDLEQRPRPASCPVPCALFRPALLSFKSDTREFGDILRADR